MKRLALSVVAVAGATALALALPTQAMAAPAPEVLADGFAGPLQIDVGSNGQVYVTQSFAGVLSKIRVNGVVKDKVVEPGEISGVASDGYNLAYAFSGGDNENPFAELKWRSKNGKTRTIADLWAYESKHNPDSVNTYGFTDISQKCADQVPEEVGGGSYPGITESHPYAVANAPGGGWFVADAAANVIWKVHANGSIRTAAVLPPQPAIIDAGTAAMFELPDCTIGHAYNFEPVPTDVEVARNGKLFVSLLPGGPEDPSLGARGSVVKVKPWDGSSRVVATGFLGAGNLALAPHGKIYVTEIFANRISVVHHGVVSPFADVPTPSGVEYANGKVYASIDVFGNGSVVTIKP